MAKNMIFLIKKHIIQVYNWGTYEESCAKKNIC